jgi:hypothetical protein
MLHLCVRHQRRRRSCGGNIDRFGAGNAEDALVLMREDLDEPWLCLGPVFQNPSSARAAGKVEMALEETAQELHILFRDERFEIDAGGVATTG